MKEIVPALLTLTAGVRINGTMKWKFSVSWKVLCRRREMLETERCGEVGCLHQLHRLIAYAQCNYQ